MVFFYRGACGSQAGRTRIYDGNIRCGNIGCGTAGIAVFDKLAAGSKAIRCGENKQVMKNRIYKIR